MKKKSTEYKPFLPNWHEFIIKKLKLRPNYFTPNDYLYILSGKDYEIAYNPRCQLLDFTPKFKSDHQEYLPYETEKIFQQLSKLWEDLSFEFFTTYGKNPEQFVVARIYGVRSWQHHFEYITYLTHNELDEWSQVANWTVQGKKFKKRSYFKFAYYGEGFAQSPMVPRKLARKKTPKVKGLVLPTFYEAILK